MVLKLLKIFFLIKKNLGNLYTQNGAQTHNTEIKSCMLHQLRQPAAPKVIFT